MNYLKTYINLVKSFEKRNLTESLEYTENHHIFPVSVFGNNNRTVRVTFREHFLLHRLLAKIFENRYGLSDNRTRKMNIAIHRMVYSSKDKIPKRNSKMFEIAKISVKKSKIGKKRPDMVGKKYFGASEDKIIDLTKRQSDARRGKHTNYPKTRKPLSNRTEEVFKKISQTRKMTVENYKNMKESDFWVWVQSQEKFTKIKGRKDRPNVNITRAMVSRGIPLSKFFKKEDFAECWFEHPLNREKFYGKMSILAE